MTGAARFWKQLGGFSFALFIALFYLFSPAAPALPGLAQRIERIALPAAPFDFIHAYDVVIAFVTPSIALTIALTRAFTGERCDGDEPALLR